MIVGSFSVIPALVVAGEKRRDDDAEKYRVIIYYTEEMIELSNVFIKETDADKMLKQIESAIETGREERLALAGKADDDE